MTRAAWVAVLLLTAVGPRPAIAIEGPAIPEEDVRRAAELIARAAAEADDDVSYRLYARAYRWDPTRDEPLASLPRLAGRIGRDDAAFRWGVIACRAGLEGWADRDTVARMAIRAAESGEHGFAAELWEHHHRLLGPRTKKRRESGIRAGVAWFVAGEAAKASNWFERVAASDEGVAELSRASAAVREGVVACHLEAGRTRRAADAADALLRSVGQPPRADYWLARICMEDSRPSEAYDAVRRSLRSGRAAVDETAASLELLAGALAAMNQSERVADELRSLLAEPQRHAGDTARVIRLAIIDSLLDAGDAECARREADALIDACLAAPQGQESADEALAAAASRRIALAASDGDADAVWPLLRRLADRWGSLDGVRNAVEAALSRDPLAELAAVWLATREAALMTPAELAAAGRVSLALGKPAESARFYRPLIELVARHDVANPDSPPMAAAWVRNWTFDLLDLDAWPTLLETIDWSAGVAAVDAEAFDARYYRALALSNTGREDDALAVIDSAPSDSGYDQLRASLLSDMRRFDEAEAAYVSLLEEAEAASANNTRAADRLRLTLAFVLDQRGAAGDAERGDELIEAVLDNHPFHATANNDLAYRWSLRGVHPERSLRMALLAVDAEPDVAAFADTLGWVLHRAGRHDEAVRELRRAVELIAPGNTTADDAVLYEHLAAALAAAGDAVAADEATRAAAALREP